MAAATQLPVRSMHARISTCTCSTEVEHRGISLSFPCFRLMTENPRRLLLRAMPSRKRQFPYCTASKRLSHRGDPFGALCAPRGICRRHSSCREQALFGIIRLRREWPGNRRATFEPVARFHGNRDEDGRELARDKSKPRSFWAA